MLLYRSRFASVCRQFSSKPAKYDSDDDLLFSNENIESRHIPRSNTPLRRSLRFIWRLFSYGSFCLFSYTYYQYKTSKNYLEQPAIYQPFVNAVKYVDDTVLGLKSLMIDPPLDKLLPDLPRMLPGYMTPKTLVLDLKGTILSTEYVFGKGYVIMKRPGLTEFLNKLSQLYEIVILCEEDTFFMSQLTESLDPNHRIFAARMGRECLCYRNGELVKDLTYLNRDLKNVIIIDKSAKMVRLQEDNAILLPEFTGAENDKALIELIPFLEHLVKDKVVDVRKEIDKYGHVDTGKKYLDKLQLIRDNIVMKQQSGFQKLFRKNTKVGKVEGEPVGSDTPKPPGQ
jgi:Dullard-like phosphatase family protein